MADFRSVQTRMWREDEWFQELDIEARLFWIYLFTNPSASPAGIYRLPLRTIGFESGVGYEAAQRLIQKFSGDGKAYYDDGVLWVVNMRRLQFPTIIDGSKEWQTATRMARDIDLVPDQSSLKARYLAHSGYPTVYETAENGKTVKRVSIRYPASDDTLPIPHAIGIDTPSVNSNSNKTKQNQTETETETPTETKRNESPPTLSAAGDKPATNGKSARFVDSAVFLSQIGYTNPDSLLRKADDTLLAKWAFYYQCLTPAQRKAVQSWPALINDRVSNNKPPRLTGEQSARFYQEWGNHDD